MGGFFGGGASVANMVGATSSVAGTAGLVPAPAAGDQDAMLFGDATFKKYILQPSSKPFTQSTSQYYFPYLLVERPENTDSGGFTNSSGAILCPHLISGNATISNIVFINHTANVNTTLVLGVYQADITTGWPLTKIAQATSINLSSTASGTVVTTAITAAVKGLFWLCVYNTSTTTAAIKAHGASVANPFVTSIVGSDVINSVPRKRFLIKNSSISSNILPSTLAKSDLDFFLNSSGANPTPTLIVTY